MKRVPFDSQVPSEALRIELKLFSQIHSRIQHRGAHNPGLGDRCLSVYCGGSSKTIFISYCQNDR